MKNSAVKPVIIHLGDAIKYNLEPFEELLECFTVIRPTLEERQREVFMKALKEGKWGNFEGILRPFWNTGGEMGRWDRELISLLPKSVKVFASAGAGFDWVDVGILAEHGILYCNGASASSEAVGDAALFNIIAVFRNMAWSQLAARSLDSEQWLEAHRNSTGTALNPRGRILGIIGLGNIGFTIAQKAFLACGMRIFYYDVMRKSYEQEQMVDATYCSSLDELLGVADCIVVATPYSGKKLIDAERLQKFKKGSRLVNIARGGLVDEDALVAALKSGHIFAAALDVHANEPHVNPELAAMNNVMLTAHAAGGTLDTVIGFEGLAMENVRRVLVGQEALTPVNKHLMRGSRPRLVV